jgi:putative tryptophan/tyrosine transport system substrate-binding protein
MRRREFIQLFAGMAIVWPLILSAAQQHEQVRKIAVLINYAETTTDARIKAFRQGLRDYGWNEGSNVRIEYRWAGGDVDRLRIYAAELTSFALDVIFASPHSAVEAVHRQTGIIPVVAVQAGDLVSAGLAQSHARPAGNVTGFMTSRRRSAQNFSSYSRKSRRM